MSHAEIVLTIVREGGHDARLARNHGERGIFGRYDNGAIGSAALADEPIVKRTVQVSGTGIDLLNGAIVHSKKPTATG